MSALTHCSFCGKPTTHSWDDIQQARRNGDPLFCDDACKNAGEPFREKITLALPTDTVRLLCRHRTGSAGGRCLECGAVAR